MILYGLRPGATAGDLVLTTASIDSAAVVRRAISIGQTDETTVGDPEK